jgi:hypothetical protein
MPHDYIEEQDGDDDDQFIVVSTTQQKWEKLHGIIGDKANSALPRNGEEESNDDVIIVRTKPARPLVDRKAASQDSYRNIFVDAIEGGSVYLSQKQLHSSLILITIITLIFYWYWKINPGKNLTESNNNDCTTKSAPLVKETTVAKVQISQSTTEPCTADTNQEATVTINQKSTMTIQSNCLDPYTNELSDATNIQVVQKNSLDSKEQLKAIQPCTSFSSMNKLHMVRQMAQDIQLVQDVLKEHALDPALAPQIAMTLQSSHHLVESQREFHYQQAILTLHHKQLDRQLSERQHRESLQAIKYDPNWEQKMQQQWQQCWNLSKNVTRLWWEVLLLRQLSLGMLPVLWNYLGNVDEEKETHNLLKEITWSILAQICDCSVDDTSLTLLSSEPAQSSKNATWTSWMAATAVAAACTTNHSLTNMILLVRSMIPHSWVDLEQCSCYGYCLIAWCLLMAITTTLHYVLRILSLPAICHHFVNLMAFVSFFGLHRIVRGILSLMTTVGKEQKKMDISSFMELGLLFLILVVQPLLCYIKTRRLYGVARDSVRKTEASDFEKNFRHGQQQLRDWEWEQHALQYLLLSVYAAFLLSL